MKVSNHTRGIEKALQLAHQALFTTTPNPRVGCVIVKNGDIIGEGYTQPPGQGHAEVQALNDARSRGHDVTGSTVYVSLEPCSHYGRTPPCADALIHAKIARVVVAIEDPNPLVAGQGIAKLRAAGIEVVVGEMLEQAHEINIGFFSRMQRGLPWVRMKIAASLDGTTALLNGQSQWITSTAARDDGHAWRARACAVLTGIGTIEKDDPQLNVRAVETPRQPHRIVVDSQLRIHPKARILNGGDTWIFTACADEVKAGPLRDAGAEVIVLPNSQGKVDLHQLMSELGRREINELHVEAGAGLNGALVEAGCVDELLIYLAPSLVGEGQKMFNLHTIEDLGQTQALRFHDVARIGDDIRLLARWR